MSLPIPNFIRQFEGPLTRELVRDPGGFGLGQVPRIAKPDATTDMVCGYCSTGCSLKLHLKEGRPVNLSPTPDYPVNLGMACPKGWEALAPLSAPNRATHPLMRIDGALTRVGWDAAMGRFRSKLRAIQNAHGGDALAFLSTGQICTEEMAFLGTLARCGMGIAHGDGNTRQCMATAVAAYKGSFGFDAPPYTYADFEESDCIVLVGSNLCIAHPILWQRVLRNRRGPEIVVIDPRRTETAAAATQHLAIAPKSDLVLLYGLARLLIENGAVERDFVDAHTSGFAAFEAFVDDFPAGRVARETGVPEAALRRLADTVRDRDRVSFWWTMGVNQSHQATRTAQAIINLALMTGNIGRPGTGANSITGQCNAMGSRLFSNTASLLGGRDFIDAAHRAEVAATTGIPEDRIPAQNCLAYDQILDGVESGRIRGLWVVATNTAHSWSGGGRLGRALEKLDLLVVQDMYADTATARFADIVLPAAGWGEKDGTFINSERRIGLVKKVARAPGEALSDFNIFKLVAHHFGVADLFAGWIDPEAVFAMLAELSQGRPCDFSGIAGYRDLEAGRGIQWPLSEPDEDVAPERRLFEDGRFFHADGRARFVFDAPRPPAEVPCGRYPFVLLTGRGSSSQWHTGTRTQTSAVLRRLHPDAIYVELSPADAAELGLETGDRARLASRRGEIEVAVRVTSAVKRGEVFVPMHFEEVNALTLGEVDPHSRQPSYKHCAVGLAPVRGPQ